MRIMFINSVVDYGSTGRIVRDIANVLKRQGHTVKIAYGRHELEDAEDAVFIGNQWSTYFHVLMTRLFGNAGLHSKKSTNHLINEIKDFQPDIIHLHNLHGYYIQVPMLMEFLKTYPAKYVWTLHDAWAISGGTAHFNYLGCEKWDDGCVITKDPKDYPGAWIFPNQKRNFNWKKESFSNIANLTLVSPSHWLQELCDQSYLKQYEHIVIPNGIDLETFKIKEVSSKLKKEFQDKFVILGVASVWEKRKGLDYFIELSQKLNDDYCVLLIGVDDKLAHSLPKNIKSIKRTNNVEELADYYNIADVFVNPTLDDNFPTTNLESLACGTPVITFDTGGSSEAIDDKTGLVTKAKNVESLYSAIKLLQNQGINKNECRQRAENYYSKEKFSKEYLELFQRIYEG